MKVLIISMLLAIFTSKNALADDVSAFKFQKRSLIEWKGIDADKWMSYDNWTKEVKLKSQSPEWERVVKERRNKEIVGRVLACFGNCLVYRGAAQFRAQFRSAILEGDEVHSIGDSYVWVSLLDGTLVRISPTSSVTFKELNIGPEENFIHARVNLGNVLWLSRSSQLYKENNFRETDTIFLPLTYFEANAQRDVKKISEDNLFEFLEESQENLNQIKRLNELVKVNNKWINNKKTYSFIVMPNGTISGYDIMAEFVVLLGSHGYLKKRSLKSLGIESDETSETKFFFRGLANKEEQNLDEDIWYRVGKKGRVIEQEERPGLLNMGEFPTKRISTILVGRELLLQRYSKFLFGKLNSEFLALEHGYRLWGALSEEKSDLRLRLNFLQEYTRRIETTNLLTSERFRRKVEARGEKVDSAVYGRRFFNLALVNYLGKRETSANSESDREILNSTTKKLWKIMHDIR